MAFPPPVMFVRSLNVTLRPHSKPNRRVFRSRRGGACSPNTDRLHLPRKSTPTAPICCETLAKTFDDRCRGRYPYGPLAFIRRRQTVRCRRSFYQRSGDRKTQDCHFDHKLGRGGLFDRKEPSAALG